MGEPDESAGGKDKPAGTQSHDPDFPDRLREFMHTGWSERPLEVHRRPEASALAERRQRLAAAFPGETLVVPSGREQVRANDTNFAYRPGSDHLWLTGEEDPESVLVIHPGGQSVLYVRDRSARDSDEFFANRQYGELWIGRRHTLEEKATELGLETERLDRLAQVLDRCAPATTRVVRGLDPTVDAAVRPVDAQRDLRLRQVLSELRLPKDPWEIDQLQQAIDATIRGFEDVARVIPADRPISERLVEGVFALRARHDGNGVGYGSIVGSGANAAILHWSRNDGMLRPGDLLLADMGVEGNRCYTADVTRTLPVTGGFTAVQREIYDIVAASQQAGIDAIKPGVRFQHIHQTCMRVLAEGLHGLGLLPVSVDEAMEPDCMFYRRWTLHGFGHMLGLDVHDCAAASKESYAGGELGEHYVLTVEPGLYFQPDDELVPAELRGIGIRIEDDVLVTAGGAQLLSGALPRSADQVEAWLAAQRNAGPRLPGTC